MPPKGERRCIPLTDKWIGQVETHPNNSGRWQWVVNLNGVRLSSGGYFRSRRRAEAMVAGSLRIQQAIYYSEAGPFEQG